MKKLSILTLLVVLGFISCKDEIDQLFLNPDGSTETRIEYLFSDALIQNGAGLRIGYNPSGYYLVLQGLAPWLQLTGVNANDADMMILVSNAIVGSWNTYYGDFMSQVAEMEIIYEQLPADQQADYDIYMNLIRIVKANATAKITDLYGDMPYSEAFQSRRVDGNLFPKFDAQEEIYKSILTDLEEAANFVSNFSSNNGQIHATINRQDILNNGDLEKWVKFANSLRLRLAMRISSVDPALAESIVAEVANAPLVLNNEDNILVVAEGPNGLNHPTGDNGQNFIGRAFFDRPARTYGGEFMINLMNEANDLRMPYYFNTNEAGEYIGVPSSPDAVAPITQNIDPANYSTINRDLVVDNLYLPGIAMTASEVNFLLAEAAMKGWVSGDVAGFYNEAMRQSIDFYYYLVSLNIDASMVPAAPEEAQVEEFLSTSTFAFDGTMEQLATQKWIHFGVLQANEAYAEWRRLEMPVLPENRSNGEVLVVPSRVTYPDNEKNFNEENYNQIRAQDTPNTNVWWDQ